MVRVPGRRRGQRVGGASADPSIDQHPATCHRQSVTERRHAPADDDAVVPGWRDIKGVVGQREELLRNVLRRRRARLRRVMGAVRGIRHVWIDHQRNCPARVRKRLCEIELQTASTKVECPGRKSPGFAVPLERPCSNCLRTSAWTRSARGSSTGSAEPGPADCPDRIGDAVRHLDIDGQVLPGRRVIHEIAARRAAVLEDDVVQDPLPAAVRQIDRQRRGYRVGRIIHDAGRDVRNDPIRDKGRREGKGGTDRTGRHRQVTRSAGQRRTAGPTEPRRLCRSTMIPFIVTVQTVVLPPITGLGVQVNAVTVG